MEIEEIRPEEVSVLKGKWDYVGLAEALKNTFPKPKPGDVKAGKVKIESILEYHDGEIKHRVYYAKKALAKAIALNGWELEKITSEAGKYIKFIIRF